MSKLKAVFALIKETVSSWSDDYAPSMGAALAYYTLFSIAPLIMIVISIAGVVFGREAAQGEIVGQLQGLMGDEGAQAIEALLASANEDGRGAIAGALSFLLLAFGATTVFGELQDAFDRIWRVPVKPRASGLWNLLRARVLSFGMMLGIAFLLMVSLVFSAGIAALGNWFGPMLDIGEALMHVINFVVSFVLITVLFAMIYKIMPRAKVEWRDVWVGSVVTSLLFAIGKLLIGLYIGKSGVASGFGAAGSLIVLLIWVYYSAQIFLVGAEFTWIYAHHWGSRRGETRPKPGETAESAQPARTDKSNEPSPQATTSRSKPPPRALPQ
jgi:membrane protein